jgi:hypothetical protein
LPRMTGTTAFPQLGPSSGIIKVPLWGIDPQTTRVSVAIRLGDGATAFTCPLLERKGFQKDPAREAWWHADTTTRLLKFFRTLKEHHGVPAAVRLEEPFGGSNAPGKGGKIIKPRPSSHRAFGVTLAGLGLALGPDVPVDFVGPTTWKARALGQGYGHAEKETVQRWARETFGWRGSVEDEADALGVGESLAVDVVRVAAAR